MYLVTNENDSREITWVDTVLYLGVITASSSCFCCSFDNAQKSLYRAFSAVFGKVGRPALHNVIIELLISIMSSMQCYIMALNVATSLEFAPCGLFFMAALCNRGGHYIFAL